MEREKRFVEHERHVDIEEYFDDLCIWAVTKCNIALIPKKLKYSGTKSEKSSQAVKVYYYNNRVEILNRQAKNRYKRYNLSENEYKSLVETQGGKCAICGKEKKLVIDHDHENRESEKAAVQFL